MISTNDFNLPQWALVVVDTLLEKWSNHLPAISDFTKNDKLAIEPGGPFSRNVKLRRIRIGLAIVTHGDVSAAIVQDLKTWVQPPVFRR